MNKKLHVDIYLSKYSSKEARRRNNRGIDLYIVDISKIIKEVGYETSKLTLESEFVLNYTIHKKILKGIYSTKCNGILLCYKNMNSDFKENLENFLDEELGESVDYTIHNF
jgi:GTPase SAR1 family protein